MRRSPLGPCPTLHSGEQERSARIIHRPSTESMRFRAKSTTAEGARCPVPDAQTARRVGFLGSSLVRMNGIDIEPAVDSKDFGFTRRRYTSSSGPQCSRRWSGGGEHEGEFTCRQFVPRCDCFRSGGNSDHLLLSWPRDDRGSGNGWGVLAVAKPAPYRPHFILGSVFPLGFGFWMAYRSQSGCIGKTCIRTSAKIKRGLL
jgi:hypothetical protein